nr:PREDICTED: uncharacterized protein LOC103983486 [Musa acuminata subsp. malaccensis]
MAFDATRLSGYIWQQIFLQITFCFRASVSKTKNILWSSTREESEVASVSLGLLGSSVAADTTILPLDGGRTAPDPPAVDSRLSPPRHRHPPHRRPCLRPGLLDLQISHRQATASWPGAEKQGPLILSMAPCRHQARKYCQLTDGSS